MTILVVEDDEIILEGLRYSLMMEGYEVCTAKDVAGARAILSEKKTLDFCLLDVMLPDGDGFALCEEIRRTSRVPILFLTACEDEVSTVRALETGADDYMAKPFRIRELLARMKAILRRTEMEKPQENLLFVGENQINLLTAKVWRGGQEVPLTAMEYRLLLVFLKHRGQVLTREQILEQLWDSAGEFVNDNTLTVYIKRLRSKLDAPGAESLLKTVRGIGYCLEK